MTSLGQSLREEREARGISLEEIASATKIVPRYLEAVEADRLDLMPGGFFIKGIIRSYAKAVGLDPEEVVGRYKAAGLLDPSEAGRPAAAKPAAAAPPTLPHAEPARPAAPPSAIEAAVAADEAAPEPERPGPSLLFEDTAKPEPSLEARRRGLVWAMRGLAAILVAGAGLLLWAPWRRPADGPRPGTVAAQPERPQPKTEADAASVPPSEPSKTGAGQAAPPALEEASPRPGAGTVPPAAEEASSGVAIEIVFDAETWIQVYADGKLQVSGLFPAGASARAEAGEKLLIHTGNAGGFTFKLNGRQAKPLGRSGQVLTDIKITPANLKDFLEDAPSGPRAG